MNASDELSGVISQSVHGPHGGTDLTRHMADSILAAGYRKPRTITTAEELDALPNGTVVLSNVYKAHHGVAISFQRWEDGCWHRGARSSDTHPEYFLPVTVIHEPAAQS